MLLSSSCSLILNQFCFTFLFFCFCFFYLILNHILQIFVRHWIGKREVESLRLEVLNSSHSEGLSDFIWSLASLHLLLWIRRILLATLWWIWLTRMWKIKIKHFAFKLFRIFVLVQEVSLTLAFTINGYNHVGKRLHIKLDRFYKARYRDLFNCLCLLLVQLHIIECDQVVCAQYEIEVVPNHERHL